MGKVDRKSNTMFNSNISIIGAAGYDCILNNTAYDIKSGPNVMNKDQVEIAKIKRETIQNLSREKRLQTLLNVNDFKVAIAYGKSSIADMFMLNNGDLIIFGVDCWKELTGDESNIFRLFLWQLKYQILEKKGKWDKQIINECISQFIQTFYDNEIDQKLDLIVNMDEFRELEICLDK